MSQRLPPLAWLRAFEAAGRLESFRRAAEELHVTPSAVSHHVRSLEGYLATPLFERARNRVRLTQEGAAYLERLSAGFAELARAADVLAAPDRARLTVGAFPFLASEVLLPHLAELAARLPEVALRMVSETALELLTHAEPERRVDAIVRYGDGRFPGCTARKLTEVALVPVCAPALAQEDMEALVALGPRITVGGPFEGWTRWAESAGVELAATAQTVGFDSYLTAMRAVEQGLGVGLGILPFVNGWLADGRVVRAHEHQIAAEQSSYLVTAQHAAERPELDLLADWLLARFAEAG